MGGRTIIMNSPGCRTSHGRSTWASSESPRGSRSRLGWMDLIIPDKTVVMETAILQPAVSPYAATRPIQDQGGAPKVGWAMHHCVDAFVWVNLGFSSVPANPISWRGDLDQGSLLVSSPIWEIAREVAPWAEEAPNTGRS